MTDSVMQALYDSEINLRIETLWDGGFEVRLGDALNGFDAETKCRTWAEAERWLTETARRLYPESQFAQEGHIT